MFLFSIHAIPRDVSIQYSRNTKRCFYSVFTQYQENLRDKTIMYYTREWCNFLMLTSTTIFTTFSLQCIMTNADFLLARSSFLMTAFYIMPTAFSFPADMILTSCWLLANITQFLLRAFTLHADIIFLTSCWQHSHFPLGSILTFCWLLISCWHHSVFNESIHTSCWHYFLTSCWQRSHFLLTAFSLPSCWKHSHFLLTAFSPPADSILTFFRQHSQFLLPAFPLPTGSIFTSCDHHTSHSYHYHYQLPLGYRSTTDSINTVYSARNIARTHTSRKHAHRRWKSVH